MANVTNKNGVRAVQVVRPDGIRVSINLGRVDQATAFIAAKWMQVIVDSLRYQQATDARAMKWLSSLPDKVHNRVARAGIAASRKPPVIIAAAVLGATVQTYIDRRTDLEPSSIANFKKTQVNLVEFFGEGLPLAELNPARADDFKRWLLRKYSRPTVCQRIKRTKTIFRDAVRRGLVSVTPFAEVSAGSDANAENDAFIERATIDKVIAATPDISWKLIISLSRYGGLRIPSELERLRWRDILWEERRIVIFAKKTKKIEGKGVRIMPLFAELETHLRQAFDEAPVGAEFVIPDRLRLHSNLGSPFQDLIARAGVQPWPRQFHNLRASRLTELLDLVPPKTVCDWLGNDPKTAMKHYMRTTDEHFERVLGPRESAASDFAADFAAATGGNRAQGFATQSVGIQKKVEKARFSRVDASGCGGMQNPSASFIGPRGT